MVWIGLWFTSSRHFGNLDKEDMRLIGTLKKGNQKGEEGGFKRNLQANGRLSDELYQSNTAVSACLEAAGEEK